MTFAKKDRNISLSVYAVFALALFLGAFVFYVVASNQKYFSSKYSLYMFLPNVEGMVPGAFITLSGLKVGVVGDMVFIKQNEVQGIKVQLKIDKTYSRRITKSSVAMVKTMGILGDKYVDITLGNLPDPALADGEWIQCQIGTDTGELLENTAEAIKEFKNILYDSKYLVSEARAGKGIVGKLMVDRKSEQHFGEILANLQKTTRSITRGKGSLGRLLKDSTLYVNLTRGSRNLHQILDRINHGNGALAQLMDDSTLVPQIKLISARTDSLLYKIQYQGSTARLLDDDQFYERLLHLTTSLDSLSTDMKKSPERYMKISLF